mgnify:FL=1
MIAHVIERVQAIRGVDEVVLATSESERDSIVAVEARARGVKVFRGSEWDVLERIAKAAMRYEADVVMRITGDCPLLCPFIAEEVLELYQRLEGVAYIWNDVTQSGWPDGTDVEVFSADMLYRADGAADEKTDREHVTPHIRRTYSVFTVKAPHDHRQWKLSVDTPSDFEFITDVFARLAPATDFSFANTALAVQAVKDARVRQ